MTRKEAETAIAKHLREIQKISAEYAGGDYLSLYCSNKHIRFNNRYWDGGEEEKTPIDYDEYLEEVNNG